MKAVLYRLVLYAGISVMLASLGSCNAGFRQFPDDNYAKGKVSDTLLAEATPGAVALIGCCLYYESELQRGIAAGQKWVYTNSGRYSPQNTSFDHMVESGHWGVNCAMPAGWAFVDMGVLEEGMRFWGASDGSFAKLDKVGDSIRKAAVITELDGTEPFASLLARGAVRPGDVFLSKGHTFIYLGDGMFFAAGHDGRWHSDPDAETEDSRHAVFESWLMPVDSCHNRLVCPTWQISFKDDYMPASYRSADGRLVRNPAAL